jgi:hypothetical protein
MGCRHGDAAVIGQVEGERIVEVSTKDVVCYAVRGGTFILEVVVARRLTLRLEYEKCRVWGHAWEDFIPMGKRQPGWGNRFSLRCVRCTTERHDVIDALGDLSQRTYEYPEDYKLAKDETPTRGQLRLELLGEMRSTARRTNQRKGA